MSKKLICIKCNNEFPSRTIVDGKERSSYNRKYCYTCVPFGKNGYNLYYEKIQGTYRECKFCGKKYLYDRDKGHKSECCNSCHTTGRNIAKKLRCLEYKGNKCIICGYNKYYGSLDFHHIDPSQKEFQIGQNWSLTWERLRKELDKCVLVCRNCHGEIHAGMHGDKIGSNITWKGNTNFLKSE